jgi:SAM-dependent methyltransferase
VRVPGAVEFHTMTPKLFMPYDVYERHQVIATLLRERGARSVLDVGGNLGVLRRFLDADILALNVGENADLRYDGRTIPFEADRFDAVVSIDTLEHIPAADRPGFLRECLRVTKRYLVVSAPFGSDAHRAREKELDALYARTFGTAHHYLNEHVRHGIPNQADIEALIKPLALSHAAFCFAGDFEWQCRHFERLITHRDNAWIKRWVDWSSKALFHPIRLTVRPYDRANRIYLCAEKQSAV